MIPASPLTASLAGAEDTIVALATAPGRSAIAVTRVSGPRAIDLAGQLVTPWPLTARRVTLCRISDAENTAIDQGLITVFPGPDSFTGEDVVEISTHGGSYVSSRLAEALIKLGGRMAAPGEFTRRAVLNGKLDITQAEAIGDMIDARSRSMHREALSHLDGGLTRRVGSLRSNLLSLAAMIAYDIDFPEEDDGPLPRERIAREVVDVLGSLDQLLATIPAGEIIKEGAIAVIAGEPNVGKSSLFNALLGQSRAIVTEIPGTTRDAIDGMIETANWPVRLVDTAGLRETADKVEQMGIEVSESYLRDAHVVLVCGDSDESLARTLRVLGGKSEAPLIRIRTKADLISDDEKQMESEEVLFVSAETGQKLGDLVNRLDETLTRVVGGVIIDVPILMRARQIFSIQQAREELAMFRDSWKTGQTPAPVAAVHLQAAILALESLVGAVSTDDVLDRLFSSFCVGK